MATAAAERPMFPALAGIWGESVGEFMGTMVLILFGDGCVAGLWLFGFGTNTPLFINWMIIAFGWGLGVVLGVYTAGTLSGAHINPAVTLAFAARGKFPWNKVIPYWVAQVAGAFVAALILWLVYHGSFLHFESVNHISRGMNDYSGKGLSIGEAKVFYTFKVGWIDVFPGAFFDQVVGTALLVGLVFAIVDVINSPPQANLAPFIIGLVVVAIGMSFGVDAGYAINPARDFGPRLFAAFAGWGSVALPGSGAGYSNYFWVPIIGPLLGAAIGVFVYDFTIHNVLEARSAPTPGVEAAGRTVVEDKPRVS